MVGGRRISGHGSPHTNSLRAWWSHRPWLVGLLGLWLFALGLLLLHGKHTHPSNGTRSAWLRSKPHSKRAGTGSHATCDAAAQPSAAEVQQKFAKTWGHRCVPFRQACYDQGTFVVFGSAQQLQQGGKPPLKALRLGNNHLDFLDFGDVIGIMQYPEIIFRPGNSHEEAPDLRQPISFSNCARPVVLYLNHLFMFGDWWIRTMPTLLNALHSPEGAWDTDYTIVVATGGQRLQAWQKLLLQPFSKHPIMTLSAASSRSIAYMPAEELAHSYTYQDTDAYTHGASSLGRALTGRRLARKAVHHPGSRHFSNGSDAGSSSGSKGRHWSIRQQQRSLQQQAVQYHKLTAQLPVTVYGRCFESLTVCSLQNPGGFPESVARPIWSGAQFVRQFWEQQYGAKYKQLGPQYKEMQEAGVLRVVIAVRANKEVRSILNLQELLAWCNAWKPQTPDGHPSLKYTRTVCIAHEFGQHGTEDSQPHGQPAAAAVADSSVTSGTAAAAQQASSESSSSGQVSAVATAAGSSVPVGTWGAAAAATAEQATTAADPGASTTAQQISSGSSIESSASKVGLRARIAEKLLEASGAVMGFLWGHSGTRNLLSMQKATSSTITNVAGIPEQQEHQHGLPPAGGSSARAMQQQQHDPARHLAAAASGFLSDLVVDPQPALQQQQQQGATRSLTSAASDLPSDPELDPRVLQQQQQQQQQGATRSLTAAAAASDLPPDPELDPRVLLSDVALLDAADVVVGLHGAQLFNALFMPAYKALVEVRPYQFTGGWPDTYFKQPLAGEDKHSDNSDGIFWFGIDTVNASNSKPGKWEVENSGCCHPRDRHTRIEPAALEYMLRRVVWAGEDTQKYKQLASKGETYITDTLQPAEEYHKQHSSDQPPQQQQQQQELRERVEATKAETKQQQQQQQSQPPPPSASPPPPPPPPPPTQQQEKQQQQQQQQQSKSDTPPAVSPDPDAAAEVAALEQEQVEQQDEHELEAIETMQLLSSSNSSSTQ